MPEQEDLVVPANAMLFELYKDNVSSPRVPMLAGQVIPKNALLPIETRKVGTLDVRFQPFMKDGKKFGLLCTELESGFDQRQTRRYRRRGLLTDIN